MHPAQKTAPSIVRYVLIVRTCLTPPCAPANLSHLLQALHVVLLLVIFPVTGVLIGDYPYIIIETFSALAMVIYIPAAVILSIRDSSSSFDHAGGEVAYLVVQLAARTCESALFRFFVLFSQKLLG